MSLPLKYNTLIGRDGVGLSQGQKQRILIARAVYKNPNFIFLDEATNALDAQNERAIVENLDEFYKGRTVVVVAHRLSTVKNANIVLELCSLLYFNLCTRCRMAWPPHVASLQYSNPNEVYRRSAEGLPLSTSRAAGSPRLAACSMKRLSSCEAMPRLR